MNTALAFLPKGSIVPMENIVLFRARREFRSLEEWMFEEGTLELPLYEIEQIQLHKMQEIMRLMLQAHIDARGNGDVGRALEVVKKDEEGIETHTHKRIHACHQQTVFGKVSIHRTGYGS